MWTIKGINDEKDFCELCGKTELKRVVWMMNDDGELKHVGTSCAAKMAGFTVKEQKKAEKNWIDSIREKQSNEINWARNHSPEAKAYREKQADINKSDIPFRERRSHWKAESDAVNALVASITKSHIDLSFAK